MPEKIFILGGPGSGKSYLANKLSQKLGLPNFALDDVYWKVKYTKNRDIEERKKEISIILKNNKKWIIEGVFYNFIEEAILEADEIIWLDINPNLLARRVIKRLKGNTFKDILDLAKWARGYRKEGGYFYHHQEILNKHKLNFVLIQNKKQFNRYIKNLDI